MDDGITNQAVWVLQGFSEDANGNLRYQTFEETSFCIGCHGGPVVRPAVSWCAITLKNPVSVHYILSTEILANLRTQTISAVFLCDVQI